VWNAIVIHLEELFHITISEFLPHAVSPEKRRIADNEFRLRPCGFYRLAVCIMGENRVPVLNVIELAENRLCRPSNAVVIEPLQVAYPDHHRGQLVRVDVRFQAVELRWVNLMRQEGWQAVLCAEEIDLSPQVKHPAQSQVKEVAAPTGGVKDANGGEFPSHA
jgi:hypothetical protein